MKMLPATLGRVLAATAAAAALAVPVMGASASDTPGVTWALPLGVTPAPLPCHASVNNSQPPQYTTVRVRIRTAGHAGVTTVAHYKTTSHKKTGTAGRRGRLTILYSISDATRGYTVQVDVTVAKDGRTGSCSTSFTPQGG